MIFGSKKYTKESEMNSSQAAPRMIRSKSSLVKLQNDQFEIELDLFDL